MQQNSKLLGAIKHVLIVGGGFGGLRVARELANLPVRVTLLDRSNHHLFQPLLYQVATAGLTAEEIASPIRSVLRNQRNARVLLGEVVRVDMDAKVAHLAGGSSLNFDYIVIAAGTETNFYGHVEWQPHMVGLKDLDDAFELRRRILLTFEAAERCHNPSERRRLLTFCVIGGGPTGVEMAGAISELSRSILERDFRAISGDMLRVVLVEMGPRVLAAFDPKLSERAHRDLTALGVEVRTHATVTDISAGSVTLGDAHIPCSVVCWAAGVRPQSLARNVGVEPTRRGNIPVTEDCSIPGHPDAFAIGDIASFIPHGQKNPLPGLAPVAMQQAASVATNIKRDLRGKPRRPFVYFDKGSMATIGTSRAVLQYGKFRMAGLLAWLAWIFVHIYYIIGFRNRFLVMFNWFWAYLTQRRGARLLSQAVPVPPEAPPNPASHPVEGAA